MDEPDELLTMVRRLVAKGRPTVDRRAGPSALALLKLEPPPSRGGGGGDGGGGVDRDAGWSVTLEASVDLPAPALRVTPTDGVTGASHHGAFVQLQGGGGGGGGGGNNNNNNNDRSWTPLWVKVNVNVNVVCSRGGESGALRCEKVNEKMTLAVSPVSWQELSSILRSLEPRMQQAATVSSL